MISFNPQNALGSCYYFLFFNGQIEMQFHYISIATQLMSDGSKNQIQCFWTAKTIIFYDAILSFKSSLKSISSKLVSLPLEIPSLGLLFSLIW